jgi:hypothetical protein
MSRNQIRRTNEVGGTKLVRFLLGAGVTTSLVVVFVLLHVTNIRAATELKKQETAHARLDDLVKSARLQAEKLRSPRHLAERSAEMTLGLVSVSQLEIVEAPARRAPVSTDIAREGGR